MKEIVNFSDCSRIQTRFYKNCYEGQLDRHTDYPTGWKAQESGFDALGQEIFSSSSQ